MRKILTVTLLLIVVYSYTIGQSTLYHSNEDATFRRATEHYRKEKYNTAQKLFIKSLNTYRAEAEQATLAHYYIAKCAMQLFNADAGYLCADFISKYPESSYVNDLNFSLGGYFYSLKKWKKCIDTYNSVDIYKLDEEQQAGLHFKKGYSLFMKKKPDEAKIEFYEIKDKNTKFTPPARYYYGHIHYKEENYQTALNEFVKLTDDKTFGPIAPYYIVQIYYMQDKFQEIIDFTPGIINTVTEKRLAEVARIAGEAYYNLEQYDSAIVYFQKHVAATSVPHKEAVYQLGYAYYMTEQYDNAITQFEDISFSGGAVGQNASYYLASCYLKNNDKENAQKAFASAMRHDFDLMIRQDATFNYALLTFEIGGDPFNDAVWAFENFIQTYPESKRINEARRLLIQAYLGARNYKKALASIEKVDVKTDELKEAYQRIAYNRAIELFSIQEYYQSSEMFKNALKYTGYNSQREAKSYYWLGESLYRQGEYGDALNAYSRFKSAPVSHTVDEYKLINYGMGYAKYKLYNYKDAVPLFRQFVSESKGDVQQTYISDSYLRIADCFFMQKSYFQSIDFYQRALDAQTSSADYALLQKGLCQGLAKKELDKISTLRELIKDYPNSVYADNAYYEIAQEYMKLQDSKQAIEALKALISSYPQSEYNGKALVQSGLLYYNADMYEESISQYKEVVTGYPGTEEARSAFLGLKTIYVDLGRIDEYSNFIDGLGGNVPRLSINEKDSLNYLAAEKYYMTANCDAAIKSFDKYIKNYPDGSYLINAHFYAGDCYYQKQEFDSAQQFFKYVVVHSPNAFTEQAYLGMGRIESRRSNYEGMLGYYSELVKVSSSEANTKEAKLAIMKSSYQLEKYDEGLKTAKELLENPALSVDEKRIAKYVKARCLQETGRDMLALQEYRELAVEVLSYQGAESKYRIVELLVKNEEYDEAEKQIVEFSGQSTSHEYWIARSFIIWADIFVSRENYFQAVETLQSIINYYEEANDGILDMAKQKLREVEQIKKQNEGAETDDGVEINIESKNG